MESTYDWLPGRIGRMERIARELDLPITWSARPPATELELQECESALARINVPFGPSHRAFLRRHNGAEHSFMLVESENFEYGATSSIFSTSQIVDAVEQCYFNDEINSFMPG